MENQNGVQKLSEKPDGLLVDSVHAGRAIIAQVAHIYESDQALRDGAVDEDARHFERCITYRDRRAGNPAKKVFGEIRSTNCDKIPMRMLHPHLAIMVHVFHRNAFNDEVRLDLELLSQNRSLMSHLDMWDTTTHEWKRPWKLQNRFNRDGLLLYHPPSSKDEYCDQYIQFHDNGIVEAVDSELMVEVLHTRIIPGTLFEAGLLRIIPQMVRSLEFLGASFPLLISISIRGNLEYAEVSYGLNDVPNKIGVKDELLVLPWVKLDNVPETFDPVLRPCFDCLARAGGRPRSPNFDEQGAWVRVTEPDPPDDQ